AHPGGGRRRRHAGQPPRHPRTRRLPRRDGGDRRRGAGPAGLVPVRRGDPRPEAARRLGRGVAPAPEAAGPPRRRPRRHPLPAAAVLVVTGYADLEGAIAALRQGAADYILKPVNPDALRASLHRVADRRRLAEAKERSEAAFRTLVEAAPCMIVILRPDHTIAYFSRFAEELTGRSAGEVLGRDFFAALLPERARAGAADCLRDALAGRAPRGAEAPVLCADGTRRWLLWDARPLPDYEGGPAALAVGQDITALKQAQERTLQAERLAAIGQMVAGLAHESGNALARSQACLEMLALEVQDRPEALTLVVRTQKAQDHLQQLYEEVRNY